MTNDNLVLLEPEVLDRVWVHWIENIEVDLDERHWLMKYISYSHFSRHTVYALHFESWLLEQGGTVRQQNRKRYLEMNAADATMFLLKWG